MQRNVRPFSPVDFSSQNLAVTTSAQTITLPTAIGVRSIRVVVLGTQVVSWAYITPTQTTPANNTTSTPVPPGVVETFLLVNDVTGISVIAPAVGSTIYITIGEGS